MSVSLADWVLERLRLVLPAEPIFDAVREDVSFDGAAVLDTTRYVIVYCLRPSHDVVTLAAGKDRADVTFTVHSFGTTRREVEWRSKRVQSLKNQRPVVDGYELGPIEHPISRLEGPDYSVPDRRILYAVDQFRVGGFES